MPLDREWLLESVDERICQVFCLAWLADFPLDDRKFVARQPVCALPVPKHAPYAFRRHFEDGITSAVAQCVVDRLEIIQIYLHDGQLGPGWHREGTPQVVAELAPVWQSRQNIVSCLMKEKGTVAVAFAGGIRPDRVSWYFDDPDAVIRAKDQQGARFTRFCIGKFYGSRDAMLNDRLRQLPRASEQRAEDRPPTALC